MSEEPRPSVYVVDDDLSIRRGLVRLLRTRGYTVEVFASAQEFLDALGPDPLGCVVLDLDMPEIDGLEAQRRLAAATPTLAIVFLTGRGSIATCAEALKAGASDFLEKPVDEARLVEALTQGFIRSEAARRRLLETRAAHELAARLTEREREILRLVVRGFSNPEIGELLGIATGTVKLHRKRMMTKLEADSVPDLVLISQHVGLD